MTMKAQMTVDATCDKCGAGHREVIPIEVSHAVQMQRPSYPDGWIVVTIDGTFVMGLYCSLRCYQNKDEAW